MPDLDPHPTAANLAAFDAGALPEHARTAVERHVAECEDCCRLLEHLPADRLANQLRQFAGANTPSPGSTEHGETQAGAGTPIGCRSHPRLEFHERLGIGAHGAVYRATQRQLGRVVAVKVLHTRLTDRPGFAERFAAETRALARLNHPNIVQAYDADRAGNSHLLVMEFVDGESLAAVLTRRGSLPACEACELTRQVAVGLQHAHERQLVHRDIKPGNLMLTRDGTVKIADFGLARLVGPDEPPEPGSAPQLLGTPDYMAPEQARDPAGADVRADLYSLGCTLYALLTGKPPFPGTSHLQTLLDHQDATPPPLTGVPPEVVAVIHRLLAKNPADRFATPAEAAEALARLTTGERTVSRPVRRWRPAAAVTVGVLAGVAVTAGGVFFFIQSKPSALTTSAVTEQTTSVAEATPPPPASGRGRLLSAEESAKLSRQRADELVEWVRKNNRWGPTAEIAKDVERKTVSSLPKAGGFAIRMGPGLLDSRKPTVVAAAPGGLFVFELTPEQAKAINLPDREDVFAAYNHPTDPRRYVPTVALTRFVIDRADDHPAGATIEGEVTADFPNPPPAGYFRLTFYRHDGRRVILMHHPKPSPAAGQATVRFKFNPIDGDTGSKDRAIPVLAEWATREDGVEVIESNTMGALVLQRVSR